MSFLKEINNIYFSASTDMSEEIRIRMAASTSTLVSFPSLSRMLPLFITIKYHDLFSNLYFDNSPSINITGTLSESGQNKITHQNKPRVPRRRCANFVPWHVHRQILVVNIIACLPLIGLFSYLKTVCWNEEAFCVVNALIIIQVNSL